MRERREARGGPRAYAMLARVRGPARGGGATRSRAGVRRGACERYWYAAAGSRHERVRRGPGVPKRGRSNDHARILVSAASLARRHYRSHAAPTI